MNTLPQHTTSKTVILAVPPQSFATLLESIAQIKQHADIIISVMAGINLSRTNRSPKDLISMSFNSKSALRSQPGNVCIECMHTCYYRKTGAWSTNCSRRLGSLLIVQEESLIDDATALVGGGPAYVSYFAWRLLMEYALLAGFDKADAGAMVVQLLRGSLALLDTFQESPTQLCEKVMTPNGTTEQAIRIF